MPRSSGRRLAWLLAGAVALDAPSCSRRLAMIALALGLAGAAAADARAGPPALHRIDRRCRHVGSRHARAARVAGDGSRTRAGEAAATVGGRHQGPPAGGRSAPSSAQRVPAATRTAPSPRRSPPAARARWVLMFADHSGDGRTGAGGLPRPPGGPADGGGRAQRPLQGGGAPRARSARARHGVRVHPRLLARRRHPPGQLARHREARPSDEQPVQGRAGPRPGLPRRRRPAHDEPRSETAPAWTWRSTPWQR